MGENDVVSKGSYTVGECQSKGKSEVERQWLIQVKGRLHPECKKLPLVSPKVSIYRVSNYLMQLREKAYLPHVVGLGAYWGINPGFAKMDEHKVEAVRRTVKRLNITVDELVEAIRKLEGEIKDCYEEIEYDGETLAWMLTVDGCFCLEFFGRTNLKVQTNLVERFSLIFERSEAINNSTWWEILQDIFKLENQIPLAVLTTILHLELKDHDRVAKRVIKMLEVVSPIPFNSSNSRPIVERQVRRHIIEGECTHLLDLYRRIVHSFLRDSNDGLSTTTEEEHSYAPLATTEEEHSCATTEEDNQHFLLPGSAVDLLKAGINFKASHGGIRFKEIWFGRAILFLPKICIDKDRETFVRNLMAFEDSFVAQSVFCDFMVFMNYLIDSERDIALLREHEIINSGVGSDKELAVLFNDLCVGFPDGCDEFQRTINRIRRHYNKPVNKWLNYSREQYCSSPCVVLSFLAGMLLLCMTGLQTTYAILQFYSG